MLLSSKCLIVTSLLMLCACASNPETINVTPIISSTTTTAGPARYGSADPLVGLQDALATRALEQKLILVLVGRAQAVEAAKTTVRAVPVRQAPTAAASATMIDTVKVRECIKAHESGNYTESSHPGSGSGAYQYVPGTWRTWSARAGFPGYAFAYLAPPDVQDAVTDFTLTHGGAGNWSPRYGNDPCTVGFGG